MEEREKFEFKSEALKKARENKGYKQDELAKQVFTTRQSISNWENGKKIPTLENVDRLAQILDVSIDDLIVRKVEERLNTNDEELVNYDANNTYLVYQPVKKNKKHLKNWKFIKIILALILIVLIIYLGSSIRKFVILYDIHKKMNNYVEIDNYYLKTDYWCMENGNIIKYDNETWRKGERYKNLSVFQNQVTTNYIFDNMMYIINNENKTIIQDSSFEIDDYNNQIQGKLISNKAKDINNILLTAFNFKVKIGSEKHYYISYNKEIGNEKYEVEERINKDTGLIEENHIKYKDKYTIEIYIFQSNLVKDEDVQINEDIKDYQILN